MRFTEHEMTVGLAGSAKWLLAMQNRDIRRGKVDIEAYWSGLDKFNRWQVLDGLSDQVLPVLIALPDIEVEAGQKVTYSDAEIKQVVEEQVGQLAGMLKRSATVRARVELVKAALDALPPRQDPDALIVPDHL